MNAQINLKKLTNYNHISMCFKPRDLEYLSKLLTLQTQSLTVTIKIITPQTKTITIITTSTTLIIIITIAATITKEDTNNERLQSHYMNERFLIHSFIYNEPVPELSPFLMIILFACPQIFHIYI